jgi:DNA-binding transcriptional LysR family regulator
MRYFVVVAEELNFGRAAVRLRMAQPPLSVQIQGLEKELGVRLFDRIPRGVRLTKEGEVLLVEARSVLERVDAAERAVHRASTGELGTLNVGGVSSAFHHVLPRVVPAFRHAYPQVDLQLKELDTADAISEIRAGTLDVAFVRAGIADDDMQLRPIHEDIFCLAVPADHRLAGEESVDLADLGGEFFVMPKRSVSPDFHDYTLTTLRSNGYTPRIAFEGSTIQSILSFVACGLGVALVPTSASAWLFDTVRYVPLTKPVSFIEVAVVWSENHVSMALRNFLKILRQST